MKLSQLAAVKGGKGPAPAFAPVDLCRAFFAIGSQQPLSRLELSELLGIGEGSTRSVIAELAEKGVVEIVKKGCVITREGKEMLREVSEKVFGAAIQPTEASFNHPCHALLLKGAASRVSDVLGARDAAVRQGGLGATIIVLQGRLLYAGKEKHAVGEKTAQALQKALDAREGDAIVLGYATQRLFAERGAWAAALQTGVLP